MNKNMKETIEKKKKLKIMRDKYKKETNKRNIKHSKTKDKIITECNMSKKNQQQRIVM